MPLETTPPESNLMTWQACAKRTSPMQQLKCDRHTYMYKQTQTESATELHVDAKGTRQ
jgi:hypothetical protein